MTFCSKRMRENPGTVFDVVFRDGSTGKAFWNPLPINSLETWAILCHRSECECESISGYSAAGHWRRHAIEDVLDIVGYAPRTEERWKVLHSDGSLGSVDFSTKAQAERGGYKAVRVRITVIDEEAA